MQVKFYFDKAAVERRGHTMEDVHQTVKRLFAVHDLPCVSDGDPLSFKDKGHGDDFACMWEIILSLLRSDWFMDCAAACVWQDEDGEVGCTLPGRKGRRETMTEVFPGGWRKGDTCYLMASKTHRIVIAHTVESFDGRYFGIRGNTGTFHRVSPGRIFRSKAEAVASLSQVQNSWETSDNVSARACAMGMTRKQITFDLSQEALRQHYPHRETAQDPQLFKRAYTDIRRFMDANGFERRQYSVYVSRSELTALDVAVLAQRMAEQLPWLRLCVKEITATNIGTWYSLLELLRSDAPSAELLPPPVPRALQKKRNAQER